MASTIRMVLLGPRGETAPLIGRREQGEMSGGQLSKSKYLKVYSGQRRNAALGKLFEMSYAGGNNH